MKSGFKLLLISLLFTGCSTTDESKVCDTGPVVFTFEVVDETTGENLFVDGLNEENQLHIENNEGETVEFFFGTERNVIDVLLGWDSKSDTYTVTIGEKTEFIIEFTLEESSSGGCTTTRLTELEIIGATYESSEITIIFVNREDN